MQQQKSYLIVARMLSIRAAISLCANIFQKPTGHVIFINALMTESFCTRTTEMSTTVKLGRAFYPVKIMRKEPGFQIFQWLQDSREKIKNSMSSCTLLGFLMACLVRVIRYSSWCPRMSIQEVTLYSSLQEPAKTTACTLTEEASAITWAMIPKLLPQ